MKMVKYWMLALLLAGFMVTGCDKDDPEPEPEVPDPNEAPALTQKINGFIKTAMSDIYLWYNTLPTIDIKYETDSKAYFKKLLNTEDKWSYITDDITAFENSLEGKEKSYGYSLAFGRFVDGTGASTGNYFGIVEYVYPNTPASRAGFVRGDLIIRMNDGNITASNYSDLLSGTSISVTKGVLTTTGIATGTTVSMVAEELNLDPVLMKKVIEREGHKIGYLFYVQFIANYNTTSLAQAFQYFQSQQITDLVLDLRYNPGGQTTAAQYLCSSVAPASAVNTKSALVTYQWNDKYQAVINSNASYAGWRGINFADTVPVKLNLSKIHILTGSGSASASELTICGLQPYMNVVMVGDTTYGKYTGSITLKPEDYYETPSSYAEFKNWGIQPIVFRFANSQGVTNFKNGFAPTYRVADELLPAFPLGDLSEPLLKKAVENITGVPIAAVKRATLPFRYEVVDRASSRFDELKRNLYVDPGEKLPKITIE